MHARGDSFHIFQNFFENKKKKHYFYYNFESKFKRIQHKSNQNT